MESKNTIAAKLYNIDELAEVLTISVKSVRNKLSSRGLRKVKSIDGRSLYSRAHLEALAVKKQVPKRKEGFYIYESKINTND